MVSGREEPEPAAQRRDRRGHEICIADIDKDGQNDIVVSGKTGLYVFYNRGTTPRPRGRTPAGRGDLSELVPRHAPPVAPEEGWTTLFNGRDLAGWTMGPDKSWAVEDGAITLRREMDGKEHNADYLWTEKPYGNFILDLEFKTTEQANSGGSCGRPTARIRSSRACNKSATRSAARA